MSKINISKKTVLAELEVLALCVGKETSAVNLHNCKNIYVKDELVFGFNDEISIFCPLSIKAIPFAVSFKNLYSVLKGMNEDLILFEVTEDFVLISDGSTKAKLPTSNANSQPVCERARKIYKEIKEIVWKSLPKDMGKAISLCSSVISAYDPGRQLQLVCVRGDKMYGTDRTRIARYKLSSSVDDELLIHPSVEPLFSQLEVDSYFVSEEIIFYKTSNGVYFFTLKDQCKWISDEKINKPFFTGGTKLAIPKEVSDLSCFSSFSCKIEGTHSAEGSVLLNFKGKTLSVSASGSEGSFVKKYTLQEDIGEQSISFALELSHLVDSLSNSTIGARFCKALSVEDASKIIFEMDKLEILAMCFAESKKDGEQGV